jgi:hypothetical protein
MRRRAKICAAEKEVAPRQKVWYDTPRDKQRYRSGHNGADSKFRRDLGISSPCFSLIFLNTENLKIEYFLPSLLFSLQRIFEQISGKKTGRK